LPSPRVFGVGVSPLFTTGSVVCFFFFFFFFEGTKTDGHWREQLELSKEIALNNTGLIAPR
jgi:alanine-alpha-ketoisovalerate/valine-pyruvate aminotransferase